MASVDLIYDDVTITIPDSARTHEGFREWAKSEDFPSRGRISFIQGEIIVDMSPEDLERHIGIKDEVAYTFKALIRQTGMGRFFGDGSLVVNLPAGVSNEPDGTFVTEASFQIGRVQILKRKEPSGPYIELEGSPDIVVEIVSASSVRKDTELLRETYHLAHIPEYWLIDPRGKDVVFDILQWRPEGYVEQPSDDGWKTSAVLGKRFRLTSSPGSMGLAEYRLEVG